MTLFSKIESTKVKGFILVLEQKVKEKKPN
jgi:hypothetical protein